MYTEDEAREKWCACPEFEGLYEVSDMGRVRSLPRKVRRRAHTVLVNGKEMTGRIGILRRLALWNTRTQEKKG